MQGYCWFINGYQMATSSSRISIHKMMVDFYKTQPAQTQKVRLQAPVCHSLCLFAFAPRAPCRCPSSPCCPACCTSNSHSLSPDRSASKWLKHIAFPIHIHSGPAHDHCHGQHTYVPGERPVHSPTLDASSCMLSTYTSITSSCSLFPPDCMSVLLCGITTCSGNLCRVRSFHFREPICLPRSQETYLSPTLISGHKLGLRAVRCRLELKPLDGNTISS